MKQPTSALEETVTIVLCVARMGEADLAGWWGSHGLDKVGRYVLRGTFRRTWQVAALELDLLSAARRHADALGSRTTALYLFSDVLPFRQWTASWLAEQKTAAKRSVLFEELAAWTLADAQTWLAGYTVHESAPEVLGDGLLLGELSDSEIEDETVLLSAARLLAASYAHVGASFRAPYFDLRRSRP